MVWCGGNLLQRCDCVRSKHIYISILWWPVLMRHPWFVFSSFDVFILKLINIIDHLVETLVEIEANRARLVQWWWRNNHDYAYSCGVNPTPLACSTLGHWHSVKPANLWIRLDCCCRRQFAGGWCEAFAVCWHRCEHQWSRDAKDWGSGPNNWNTK